MHKQRKKRPPMPLVISPVDGMPMIQIHRFGIEINVCPTSGGVWLDKDELEKVVVMLRQASNEENKLIFDKHHTKEKSYVDKLLESDSKVIKYDHSQINNDTPYTVKKHQKGDTISKVMSIFNL